MVDSKLTSEALFLLERYAEALNTLAAALSSLISDEIIVTEEARAILFRVGVLSEQDIKDVEEQKK